ncbi:hypothetical protein OsI_33782 [Oryza sativa Indica Group]|uniref:Uncharacterized protein n=1 Tax=Oryza sativa subsp. indica TaxID=39946 RepID=A2Z7U6_ORYSI|nr:hypothetical protein OsI_33782 [Oryza sativa Indica Group]
MGQLPQDAVAANGNGGGKRPHAVVIPYPLQGHVIPAVHLALRLAARGFAVTFVNTESVHRQITSSGGGHGGGGDDIFAGAGGGAIRYELVSDGFPLGFDRSLNHDQYMEGVLHVLPAHVDELLRRVVGDGDDAAATCLVADTFFVWPATLARKLGVPYVSFWTEPAIIFSLYYHMDLLTKNGHFNCKAAPSSSSLPSPILPHASILDADCIPHILSLTGDSMEVDEVMGSSESKKSARRDAVTVARLMLS